MLLFFETRDFSSTENSWYTALGWWAVGTTYSILINNRNGYKQHTKKMRCLLSKSFEPFWMLCWCHQRCWQTWDSFWFCIPVLNWVTYCIYILQLRCDNYKNKNLRELSQSQERFAPKFKRNWEQIFFLKAVEAMWVIYYLVWI